ncbi:MAG TPA: NADH-quinone oxidoreductase subunit C [Ignavibacteriaceae bacterium]|nr:NADH-quinone oxidoreductase subunit C [Ignavibacteriaceae bacterium]
MKTEEIFQVLKEKFGDSIIELNTANIEPFILVNPFEIDKISYFLRDTEQFLFDNLMLLSGVDDANGTKANDIITGGTLSVYYHLESTQLNHKVVLRVSTPRENPEVVSVEEVWRSADWHEREAYDMFGIIFLNHPDLRRILMPYDWEFGFPLRKDYKNPEFYQGMKIPY